MLKDKMKALLVFKTMAFAQVKGKEKKETEWAENSKKKGK